MQPRNSTSGVSDDLTTTTFDIDNNIFGIPDVAISQPGSGMSYADFEQFEQVLRGLEDGSIEFNLPKLRFTKPLVTKQQRKITRKQQTQSKRINRK